jgi:hypothetical protein
MTPVQKISQKKQEIEDLYREYALRFGNRICRRTIAQRKDCLDNQSTTPNVSGGFMSFGRHDPLLRHFMSHGLG